MAIVREGCLRCPRCREYVIEIDPADFPDGPPETGESPTACSECKPHAEMKTPEEEFTCRRLRTSSLRNVTRPRWVAMYEGNWREGARRRVGLLVPRPTRQSPHGTVQIAYSLKGDVLEFTIGNLSPNPYEWYTARAGELTREQQKAIREFHRSLTL
ncbi:hypothetical protein [Streptomyces sp. NPDC017260]|uniref:hypothetical protein n=1 Tax=unclassified Streptomyces TaxID=2593676 RepID=UPI0037BB1C2A